MEATSFRNDSDPLPEKLISDLDRTHVFHFSGIYELPFGKGKPLFSGAPDRAGAGGRLAGGRDVAASNRSALGSGIRCGRAGRGHPAEIRADDRALVQHRRV